MECSLGNDIDDWLQSAPSAGLLETDVAADSYNATKAWQTAPGTTLRTSKAVVADESSLAALSISDTSPLNDIKERGKCGVCAASRMYFCYTCHVALPEVDRIIPRIDRLPIKVDIVKHPHEIDGKSTAIHAAVICPTDVRIFIYPDMPDYRRDKSVLLYPGKRAKGLRQVFCNPDFGASEAKVNHSFERVVLIDGTWKQSKKVASDRRLRDLPQVFIEGRETAFWRGQRGKSHDHLATIEAVYFFLRDYQDTVTEVPYDGEYDDMLFLFKFMHEKIHTLYK